MPSFLEMLRLKNIFNPQQAMLGSDMPSMGGISGNIPAPTFGGASDMMQRKGPITPPSFGTFPVGPEMGSGGPPEPQYDVMARMKELYTPETESSDRFQNLINQYPEREKPGFWRTIAAILTDMQSGPEAGMAVAEMPFRKKLEDWKNQIPPSQAAANLERQTNVNERTMAYQTISQELRAQADEERAKNNERNANIREMRARVYEFKAMNPNLKFDFSGTTIKAIDPQTGKITDTGVETGNMSRIDILNLQQEHALERIGAQGAQARETEGVRQTGREGLAETRGWTIYNVPDGKGGQKAVKINEVTGEVVDLKTEGPVSRPLSGTGAGRGELPTQTRVRQFIAARELANARPDLAPFIKLGSPGANDFVVAPISQGGYFDRGPTKAQHDEIMRLIYGGQPAIAQPGRTGKPTVAPEAGPTPVTEPAAPAGRVTVQDKNGNKFTVPANQVELAKKQGYTVIGE